MKTQDRPSHLSAWVKAVWAAVCAPEPERTPLPAGLFVFYRFAPGLPWTEIERETAEVILTEAGENEAFFVQE